MREKGSSLVIVLFATVVFALVSSGIAYRAAIAVRWARDHVVATRLRAHIRSAANVAIARLRQDSNEFDHRSEAWHTHAPLATEGWIPELEPTNPQSENYQLRYSVTDEEAKLLASHASSAQLRALQLTDRQVAQLFDWQDADDFPRANGLESDGYTAIAGGQRLSKNAPLEDLREMLHLPDFDDTHYWGEDGDHDRRLDANENDGPMRPPVDDMDGDLRPGLVDLLTSRGDGSINVNTASLDVLRALPISEEAADRLYAFTSGSNSASSPSSDHAFASSEDLARLQGLPETDLAVLTSLATYRSTHFRVFVESVHRPSGIRQRAEILVRKDDSALDVLLWRHGP